MNSWERDKKSLEFRTLNNKNFFPKSLITRIELLAAISKAKNSKRKSKDSYKKIKAMVKSSEVLKRL